MSKYDLKTGDILLFDGNGKGFYKTFDFLIKYFTKSPYTHVAMVLKDPEFIHPSLKGYYIWESGWNGTPDPQDGKVKLGVQLTPLYDAVNNAIKDGSKVYYRKLSDNPDNFTNEKLTKVHDVVYGKPYDIVPKDWIDEAFHHTDKMEGQNTRRFWCSALVGYIYAQCGVLKKDTKWSCLAPADYSTAAQNLEFDGDNKFVTNDLPFY
jgi:cell wall-associated NlpC family hydrolase